MRRNKQWLRIFGLSVALSLLLAPVAQAATPHLDSDDTQVARNTDSPRVIVELESPALAVAYQQMVGAASADGALDVDSVVAQQYIDRLQAEQALFVAAMQQAVPGASVATYRNESGVNLAATYQIVFNGLSVEVGSSDRAGVSDVLARLPGVKSVYLDRPYFTDLYTSTVLINAPALWGQVGGQSNGGAGVKLASMDGGAHKDAPMMSGVGYTYPPGYGPNGLGLTSNNNGKIIVSRAYFRPWDPPAAGDQNPWPGVNGTSHGMHTSSTAAGNMIPNASYLGLSVGPISGVAPRAYVMSYRVFYASVLGSGSFYTTEGLAALEDIVKDDADVVNNSWGGGPGSSGGKFDPLDQALINASNAGVFVSMSAGNAGPGNATTDHPSDAYINVAASTSGGTLAAGQMNVIKPEPTDAALQGIAYGTAEFGPLLPFAQKFEHDFVSAKSVDPNNSTGCAEFPSAAFQGKAALIARGGCNFSDKVRNAQTAQATFVVIYDSTSDEVQGMSCGDVCADITISSIRIPKTIGAAVLAWFEAHPTDARLQVDTFAFQEGNQPDHIADFSSRGPGVGAVLKPDIAAPGVNILAQGYAEGVVGEARHLGYGQVSGTSMASPHVAGAAALLRQARPTWPNAWIKSALMSTAKYMNVFNTDESPAQPLDMGAGRLDLTRASDPGVILSPPSLSYGIVYTGAAKTITVTLQSVANAAETYSLSTLFTGDSFTQTRAVAGVSISPASILLNPGETKSIQVTFDPATSDGFGDNQGYIVIDGPTHDAHMPLWGRVVDTQLKADVLLVDGDFSTLGASFGFRRDDYRQYYTDALTQAGYTFEVLDYDLESIPPAALLMGYRAVVYFTGENDVAGAGIVGADADTLVDFLNNGGTMIAFGQDLSTTMRQDVTDPPASSFLYQSRLGANWIQDSVSQGRTPSQVLQTTPNTFLSQLPVAMDLTVPHIYDAGGLLLPENEVPPVITQTITGTVRVRYDAFLSEMRVVANLELVSSEVPVTVTAAHIHSGTADAIGPPILDLGVTPTFVTDTLRLAKVFTDVTTAQAELFLTDNTYFNVHTNINPGGDIRVQFEPAARRNQPFVDEIDNRFYDGSQDQTGVDVLPSIPLLRYPGNGNLVDGTVAMAHRQQPSLERPGITYNGRTIYAAFGLEGMNETFNPTLGFTPTSRSTLLHLALQWGLSQAATNAIINSTAISNSRAYTFTAQPVYGVEAAAQLEQPIPPVIVSYRWDFGDGSPYVATTSKVAGHTYACGGSNSYSVRVELTDQFGNKTVDSKQIDVTSNCENNAGPNSIIYLPVISK